MSIMEPFPIDDVNILNCIINHVTLPPKLPTCPEGIPFSSTLLDLLLHSLTAFRKSCGSVEEKLCSGLIQAVNMLEECHSEQNIILKEKLACQISRVVAAGKKSFLKK